MLVALALVVTVAAAARSTWSPCGVSMLSSLTPLAERGRRTTFAGTAAWFVTGSLLGGAALGALGAALAATVAALAPASSAESLAVVATALVLAAAYLDLAVAGRRAVGHHRQVNERWLDHFRPWVYGAGFGFQIGSGLATYVTTAGVYLVVLLGALTADPVIALALGLCFGLVRGLAVLLGRSITSPESLRRFHARFAALEPASRQIMAVVELLAAPLILVGAGSPSPLAAAAVSLVAVGSAGVVAARGLRPWARRSRAAGV